LDSDLSPILARESLFNHFYNDASRMRMEGGRSFLLFWSRSKKEFCYTLVCVSGRLIPLWEAQFIVIELG
jgi:hypothetical protein